MNASDTIEPSKKMVAILVTEEMLQAPEFLLYVRLVKKQLESMDLDVIFLDEKEYLARGRVPDCDCQMIQCVCVEARQHDRECRWRKAITAPVGFECEHGLEECRECDPCTCTTKEK
jgi:hypothetical protein